LFQSSLGSSETISYFDQESEFQFARCPSSPPIISSNKVAHVNSSTFLDSCPPITVGSETLKGATWLLPEDNVIFLDMLSIGVTQSQGDIDFVVGKDSVNTEENQCSISCPDLVDFNFLDSIIKENETSDLDWQNTSMNLDLKDLLTNALSDETMDVSSLLDFNNDFSTELYNEQSYNLNSIQDLPVDQMICQDIQSCKNSRCEEVSSTTCASLDLQEENLLVSTSASNLFENENCSADESNDKTDCLAGKKYMEMRRKNNIASQRSRKTRKKKDSEMEEKLKALEKENKDLLLLSQKLEKERDVLHKKLMGIITRK